MENSKVVVIADFVYPNYTGGSARYVYDLIKGFYENNIDFLLITRSKKGVFAIDEKDEFFELLKKEKKVIEVSSIKDVLKSFRFIKKNDILNIHHPVLGIFYSFLKNKKVYFFHGPLHKEYREISDNKFIYFIKYLLQKYILLKSSKVLVLSNYMKNEVEEIVKNKSIKIVGPIFNMDKFYIQKNKKELRKKYNFSEEKTILFTSRRLTNRTGVLELTQSFIHFFDDSKYELIIVGKGELQEKLENLIKNKDNIKYYNFVSDEKLIELMKLSDVYILPTKELEGFGLVILEAFSVGLPVVVSDKAGGGKEFIGWLDKNLIYSLNDSDSLLSSIEYAKNLNIKTIRKYIKNFDYKLQSRNIYNEIIK